MKLRNEDYHAILSAMDEGILVFDDSAQLVEINATAMRLLHLEQQSPAAASIDDIFRDEKLNSFAHKAVCLKIPLQEHAVLRGEQEVHLKLYARPLGALQGRNLGTLLVVSDITRLRHLESIRRDFVANVSHELKTPVTSIKGFVETLLDGAISNPKDAKNFLQIIARQADRLNNIFEDLLILARLEQQEEENLIELKVSNLQVVLSCAVQDCQQEAKEKRIEILLECLPDVELSMNARLLEQAVTNLISNGIKYSEPGNTIKIEAEQIKDQTVIHVKDFGCGIGEQHLARIWERFYRVDQARSRKLGGTGLGLAIVKHIAQVHGGYPSVQSVIGQGSTFSLHLPANPGHVSAT